MKKLFYLMAICVWPLALSNATRIEAASVAGASAALVEADLKDERIEKLTAFFEYYKAPLAGEAKIFIQMADKYGIDWRLLPAISGVESTFAKFYISGTYNAYGWGGGTIRFESWADSIEKVTKALSEKYYARGLDTPFKIAPVYCPPSKVWARNVTYFMEKLENFSNKDFIDTQLEII